MKENYNIYLFGLSLILALFSCNTNYTNTVYNPDQYKAWVGKHRLILEEQIDDIAFKLSYLPGDFKFLMDFRTDFKDQDIATQTSYQDKRYFKLDISSEHATGDMLDYKAQSQQEISGRLEYILSDMKNDFYIYNNADTIYCQDVHYERNYGLNNKMSLMVTFANNPIFNENTVRMVYHERFFNSGPVTFNLDCKALNNIPQLKIK